MQGTGPLRHIVQCWLHCRLLKHDCWSLQRCLMFLDTSKYRTTQLRDRCIPSSQHKWVQQWQHCNICSTIVIDHTLMRRCWTSTHLFYVAERLQLTYDASYCCTMCADDQGERACTPVLPTRSYDYLQFQQHCSRCSACSVSELSVCTTCALLSYTLCTSTYHYRVCAHQWCVSQCCHEHSWYRDSHIAATVAAQWGFKLRDLQTA
jgi:hypothetical protein